MKLESGEFSHDEWVEMSMACDFIPLPQRDMRISIVRAKIVMLTCATKIQTILTGGLGRGFRPGEDAAWIRDLAGAINKMAIQVERNEK